MCFLLSWYTYYYIRYAKLHTTMMCDYLVCCDNAKLAPVDCRGSKIVTIVTSILFLSPPYTNHILDQTTNYLYSIVMHTPFGFNYGVQLALQQNLHAVSPVHIIVGSYFLD